MFTFLSHWVLWWRLVVCSGGACGASAYERLPVRPVPCLADRFGGAWSQDASAPRVPADASTRGYRRCARKAGWELARPRQFERVICGTAGLRRAARIGCGTAGLRLAARIGGRNDIRHTLDVPIPPQPVFRNRASYRLWSGAKRLCVRCYWLYSADAICGTAGLRRAARIGCGTAGLRRAARGGGRNDIRHTLDAPIPPQPVFRNRAPYRLWSGAKRLCVRCYWLYSADAICRTAGLRRAARIGCGTAGLRRAARVLGLYPAADFAGLGYAGDGDHVGGQSRVDFCFL